MTTHTLIAYTDGASKGNPGAGGWGVVLHHAATGATKHIAGAVPDSTNNAMELLAAIQALVSLKVASRITLYTDSKYLADGWNEWLPGWLDKGWRTASRKPVANAELWQALLEAVKAHELSIVWLRGHDGQPGNEAADRLASGAAAHLAATGEVGPWCKRLA